MICSVSISLNFPSLQLFVKSFHSLRDFHIENLKSRSSLRFLMFSKSDSSIPKVLWYSFSLFPKSSSSLNLAMNSAKSLIASSSLISLLRYLPSLALKSSSLTAFSRSGICSLVIRIAFVSSPFSIDSLLVVMVPDKAVIE